MIPKGYNHKATSTGFNGKGSAVIYRSDQQDDYFIVIDDREIAFLTLEQLKLLHHAVTDVLDMAKR